MIELKLYVPLPGSALEAVLAPGSGIVGTPDTWSDRIWIDYEGNVNRSSNIKTWEDKVFHAAGRHVTRYPTVARAWPLADELIEVGLFTSTDDWKQKTFTIINSEALEAWKEKHLEKNR